MDQVLTNEEIIAFLDDVVEETVFQFNERYGEEQEVNEDLENYILAFGLITIYGYSRLFRDKTIPRNIKDMVLEGFDKSYKGIQATTQKDLLELRKRLGRDPLSAEIDAFRTKRIAQIKEGLFDGAYNPTEAILAMDSGYRFVACTNTPPRVRPTHQANDRRFWRLGTYAPWHDYNCKCRYSYFQTRREAEEAGFEPL
jgi:hypothetical protein